MMVQSMVAVIERRNAHAQQLALAPRQRAGSMHQLLVEIVVLAHHGRMNRVNLNDVVGIGHTILGRQRVGGHVINECHFSFPRSLHLRHSLLPQPLLRRFALSYLLPLFRHILDCSAVPILGFVALLAMHGPAAAQTCPALQVRNPDGNYIVPGVKGDIAYSGDQALDAYVQQGSARRPSVIVIHGGGWSSGSRVAHVGQILETLTLGGYHWFSVDYRAGGLSRFDYSITDLRAALAFIRCRAAEFGIDANQLVLRGEDSGAHLAALLAAERQPGVLGAVLIGGFYDLAPLPLPQTPPLLVVHGGADSEAPPEGARRYCGQVSGGGGRCQFLEVAGASHRSENWLPSQWTYVRWSNGSQPSVPDER